MGVTLGVFAAAFLLYLSTLYPSIAPRDSADMAHAAVTLGVAHPPGYPLYSLLGHAWIEVFPIGNAAYRLNVLSALAGAAAAAGLFVAARRRGGVWGGLAAAAVFACSASLWKFSLLEEKYSLHALFAAGLLLLADGERATAAARARLSGLLIGLGLVNHQSLLLWLPALGLLWWKDRRIALRGMWLPALVGLGMNAFLWARTGSLTEAIETALRMRYGPGSLFAGYEKPGTETALLIYGIKQGVLAVGLPAALIAILRLGYDRARALALLIGAMLTGPVFVMMSKFDTSNWVAMTILEPAFILPALSLALLAGENGNKWVAMGLIATAPLLHRVDHRDDFLAHDYVNDLRRNVPPGGHILAGGDTASFGLKMLAPDRHVAPARLVDAGEWIRRNPNGCVTGLGPADLEALGIMKRLSPQGLVQVMEPALSVRPGITVLRRSRSWVDDESYARDIKLAYAFSYWLTARIIESHGRRAPEYFDLKAASIDPVDYQLQ